LEPAAVVVVEEEDPGEFGLFEVGFYCHKAANFVLFKDLFIVGSFLLDELCVRQDGRLTEGYKSAHFLQYAQSLLHFLFSQISKKPDQRAICVLFEEV